LVENTGERGKKKKKKHCARYAHIRIDRNIWFSQVWFKKKILYGYVFIYYQQKNKRREAEHPCGPIEG
jgi:hypothetical protein